MRKTGLIAALLLVVLIFTVKNCIQGVLGPEALISQSQKPSNLTPLIECVIQDQRCQFYENKGQISLDNVLFYGCIPEGTIGFASGRVLLWLHGSKERVDLISEGADQVEPEQMDTFATLSSEIS